MHLLLQFLCLPPGEHTLIAWLWWPGGCAHESHRIVTIEETPLGRLLPQGTTQPFCESPLCLSQSFSLRGRLELQHTFIRSQRIQASKCHLCALSLPHHSSSVSPKKEPLYSWSPNFCNCYPGAISRSSGSGSQQGLLLWSHRLYINLHALETLPETLASNQLKSRC